MVTFPLVIIEARGSLGLSRFPSRSRPSLRVAFAHVHAGRRRADRLKGGLTSGVRAAPPPGVPAAAVLLLCKGESMAAMGPDPARGPDLQQLAQLCPQLPMATVESVYGRYCKDGNRALDALLGISSPRQLPRPVAVEQVRARVADSPLPHPRARAPRRPPSLFFPGRHCRRASHLSTPHLTQSTTTAARTPTR